MTTITSNKLKKTISEIDDQAQDGLSKISSIAHITHQLIDVKPMETLPHDIAQTLKTIQYLAEDLANSINCEAEEVGCNFE